MFNLWVVADGQVNMKLWHRDILEEEGQNFIRQIHEEAVASRDEPENMELRQKALRDLMIDPNYPYVFIKGGGVDATVQEYNDAEETWNKRKTQLLLDYFQIGDQGTEGSS